MVQFKSQFPREVLLCRVCYVAPLLFLFFFFFVYFTCRLLKYKCHMYIFSNTTTAWLKNTSQISFILPPHFFQVGDFYEAIGIDACILVEYAGLNPFGGLRSDSIPKAGCPVVVWIIVFTLFWLFWIWPRVIMLSNYLYYLTPDKEKNKMVEEFCWLVNLRLHTLGTYIWWILFANYGNRCWFF